MLVVAALGQSALISPDVAALVARIGSIAKALAPIARSHQLVITHSSSGRLLSSGPTLPLDLRTAQAAGLVGHLLARELRNVLPGRTVASLLAEAIVPGEGGAGEPRRRIAGQREVSPCRIVELPLFRRLVKRDELILCIGCVPVQLDSVASLLGSEVRLDHDEMATTLATELGADILLLLTDVPAVYPRWPDTSERLARFESRQPVPESLDPATIGNKLQAACRFASMPGTFAVIGAADEAESLVAGRAGTCVVLASP